MKVSKLTSAFIFSALLHSTQCAAHSSRNHERRSNYLGPEDDGNPNGFLGNEKDAIDVLDDPAISMDLTLFGEFYGFTSYANLPPFPAFSPTAPNSSYDIMILGAPFDTAVSARPGARYGPRSIRSASGRIHPFISYDIHTGYNPFLSWATIVDGGDVKMEVFDNRIALRQLEKAHRVVANRPAKAANISTVPRIITLGGDHTTTLPALRAAHKKWGNVSVVHFDSHLDTWDPDVFPPYPVSDYAKVNHGTFLHVAAHEGLLNEDRCMHVGTRAPQLRPGQKDKVNDRQCGFDIVYAKEIDEDGGVEGIVKRIKERVGDSLVYLSLDIDVLDPAYAPGTGTPEVGGWSTRELLRILEGLEGLKIIGADVVEVSPSYDTNGEITALAAAEVVRSFVQLMVKTPVPAPKL
ncbi:Guanidinobutyrase [Dactylella cylindrospora]|nr:Guanidinobutyrase [Dactylella cylindrospora]